MEPRQTDSDSDPSAGGVGDPQAEQFYEGAYRRIRNAMLVLAVAAGVALWVRYGWRMAGGFAVGCVIASLNFLWLKQIVSALSDRVAQAQPAMSSRGAIVRFLLRYLLRALGAFVILRGSFFSVYGLVVGLFLPVAAIMWEAVYEVYVAARRGI